MANIFRIPDRFYIKKKFADTGNIKIDNLAQENAPFLSYLLLLETKKKNPLLKGVFHEKIRIRYSENGNSDFV